ncbi:MAG: EamA family transporter [Synergistales bacterium]|nr:EamA family transporter [Synergistales bacterium]
MGKGNWNVKILLAFLSLYLIWGSTYLAIRFMVETVPPFMGAGTRFFIAGTTMMAWAAFKGNSLPPRKQWLGPALFGTLLLAGTNGCVSWASQFVPSGVIALLQATVPLWFVLLDAVWIRQEKNGLRELAAVLLGLCGVAFLVFSRHGTALSLAFHPKGLAVALSGPFLWAFGSLLTRRLPSPPSNVQSSGIAMSTGGILLLTMSLLFGETQGFDPASVTAKSLLAVSYLIVFGSFIAFSAYNWLIRIQSPTLVGTYTFVNPLVALILGRLLAGESISLQAVLGGLVIVGSVILLWNRKRKN